MNDSRYNVIVTGGSRGLGLAIVSALVYAGYRVIVVARNKSDQLGEIERGGSVFFRPFDLMELDAIPALVTEIRKEFGQIYGLVNNAGIGTSGLLTVMPQQEIQRLVALNTIAPIILSKYAARSMMVHRAGRIINIASIVAFTGYMGVSVYSATKASLIGFTRSLARELGPLGITVNAVAPGFVATEMTDEMTPNQRDRIAHRSALHRLIEPEDVANAVEYLMSTKAGNITGTVLTVDAGSTA